MNFIKNYLIILVLVLAHALCATETESRGCQIVQRFIEQCFKSKKAHKLSKINAKKMGPEKDESKNNYDSEQLGGWNAPICSIL